MANEKKHEGLIVGRYRLGEVVGAGAHGTVYLAEDLGRGGEQVAFKLVRDSVDAGGWREPAAQVLRWFRHPNWAEILDAGVIDEYAWFQTTRYIRGKSLDHLEGPQDPELVWRFLEDGARVLGAIHRQGLIHYDVTPGNFLMEEAEAGPQFVLTDGGLAHLGPVEGFARGTPLYMAPELTEDRRHDHRVDLYSLGLVAFRLATGQGAHGDDPNSALPARRRQPAIRAASLVSDIPVDLDETLAQLLQREPRGRPSTGVAVIANLSRARGRRLATLVRAEAISATVGGHLVGHKDPMTRFVQVCAQLATATGSVSQTSAPPPGLSDPVLVLTGQSGVGCTRVAREMAQVARLAELPVLVVSGRDGAPDPNDPLAGLLEGLARLSGRAAHGTLNSARQSAKGQTRRERAFSKQKVTEKFVKAAQKAARVTPFVLIAEDVKGLAPLAQSAIQALARDQLSRAEHGPQQAAPPLALIADLGDQDPAPYALHDSASPSRPLLHIEPLTPSDVLSMCLSKFPGLEIKDEQARQVHVATAGLPGVLVALLAEAVRREDLGTSDGQWYWNTSAIADYQTSSHITPQHAEALNRADAPLSQFLSYLSLVDSHLPTEAATRLWKKLSSNRLPTSSLIVHRVHEGLPACSLPTQAIHRSLSGTLAQSPQAQVTAARAVLEALEDTSSPTTVLDRARLQLLVGEARECIATLSEHWHQLDIERRLNAQRHLRSALESDAVILKDAPCRASVAGLLERGPDALHAASTLAQAFPSDDSDHRAILQTAEVLEDGHDTDSAMQLLSRCAQSGATTGAAGSLIHVRLGMLALNKGRRAEAASARAQARALLRSSEPNSNLYSAVSAEYLTLHARLQLTARGPGRALRLLAAALRAARRAHDRSLLAHLHNNLGITYAQSREREAAQFHFNRSLRLKRALGDVKGVLSTSVNLARLHSGSGELLEATQLCLESVSSAQRYGLHDLQARALRLLADAYDRQHRPTLALDTFLRAWRVVSPTSEDPTHGSAAPALQIASDMAPIAAAVGRLALADRMLRATARFARAAPRRSHARAAHHLTATLVALHSGVEERLVLTLGRCLRRIELFIPHERFVLGILGSAWGQPGSDARLLSGVRKSHDATLRFLYRTYLWLLKAKRSPDQANSVPGLTNTRDAPARGIPAGGHGRLAAELVLRASAQSIRSVADGTLAQLQSYASLGNAVLLQAKISTQRARRAGPARPRQRAEFFSQAVAALDHVQRGTNRSLKCVPTALLGIADDLRGHTSVSMPESSGLTELHAIAHKALVRPSRSTTGSAIGMGGQTDNRLASALRRVLEASAQMRAGEGPRDHLLDSITRHTIDITGAQRACVVLQDADAGFEIRESACAGEAHSKMGLRDVSNTVIRKVLQTSSAIYRPYVVEDEDLLEESVSIPQLGLLSILCVPLKRGQDLYGVLYADSTSVGAFEPVDLEVLSLFAEQAAAAIEASRLLEDVRRSFTQLKKMQERLVRGERLRVIGEISSGVAHEFNNLLTAILARIQMMSLSYLPQEARQDLELIEKAALDAAAVVRRLQSFSRHQRQGDFTAVDLADICRDAVDLLRPLWRAKRLGAGGTIDVQAHLASDVVVRGDPTELREIATNLVKNAVDSVEGDGRVTITAARIRGKVHLKVADNGCGISEEAMRRIFDTFFTTKGERGTGLGLPLTRQIVERHGGTIEVTSTEGQGTSVVVELPAVDQSQKAPAAESKDESHKGPAFSIVVVDDDENVLRPLCRYLEQSGCLVFSASSGVEGLKAAMLHNPDVVLTDARMPGMDGIELCRRLHDARPHLPIVLMSGWASDLDRAQAWEVGAREVLPKPFEMTAVRELLSAVSLSGTPRP